MRRRLLQSPVRILILLACVIACAGCITGRAHDDAPDTQIDSPDHAQWGRTSRRNNVVTDPALARTIPITWDIGSFDDDTGDHQPATDKHIKWVARLGSNSFGNPVVAGGKVFVGTNNDRGYLERFPAGKVDLGVLLCFDEKTGRFLWQYSSEKLGNSDRHDFAGIGICASPYVEGDRVWLVTNRCEVVCLDANGFADGVNDGVTDEAVVAPDEADVIWRFDMHSKLGVQPLFMSNCSITAVDDLLLVNTSNASDERGEHILAPDAPSFIMLEKATGKLRWQDSSPGSDIIHGSWSSPAVVGTDYVIFPGGDGLLYGFNLWIHFRSPPVAVPSETRMVWRFDCNLRGSEWKPGGRGDRNSIIATPVVTDDGRVIVATGQNPEFGAGPGVVWCIDPIQFETGKVEREPAALWKYTGHDLNNDGKLAFDETFHRSISSVVVKDNLVIAVDLSGVVHCLDLRSGKPHWTHDTLAGCWGSPLIVGDRVYLGTDSGHVFVFALSKEKKLLAQNDMGESVYSTPIVANGVLYIATKTRLFAIAGGQWPPE